MQAEKYYPGFHQMLSEIEKNEISLQPSEVTLHNILQFAATYRAVQVNSEKVISVIIN